MSNVNQIQTNFWKKKIDSLVKKSDVKGLENYKKVIQETTGIDDSVKDNYVDICDKAIEKIQKEMSSLTGKKINSENITVGETTRHAKVTKKTLAKCLGGVAVFGLVVWGITSCGGSDDSNEKDNTTSVAQSTESQSDSNVKEIKSETLSPTLAFDPENTDVMTTNISTFLNDSLGKGLILSEDTLANDLEAFVDFYVALNIDEIGPGYLAELYQTDKKSYLDVFNNFLRYALEITDEAMMGEKDNVINISSITSNKVEGEMLQQGFNLLAELHTNGLTGNKEALEENAGALGAILDEVLLSEKSNSYSTASKIMLAYIAMNADELLRSYTDIVVVDDDIRKVMYEDAEISCAMTIRDYKSNGNNFTEEDLILLLNASEVNQSGVSFAAQLEKKFDQMVLLLNTSDIDYTGMTSVAEVIETLMKSVDLSLYVENQELEAYVEITHEINFPSNSIPEGAIKVGKGYVTKEQLDQYGATTIEEYENAVIQQTEEQLQNETTFTDDEGKVTTGEDAYDAVEAALAKNDGYNAGFMGLPSTPPAKYVTEYNAGYAEGVAEHQKQDQAAQNDVKVEIENLDTPIQESTETIDSGNVNPSSGDDNSSSVGDGDSDVPSNEIDEPVVEEIVPTEDQIIEEEVIEEGIVEPTDVNTIAEEEAVETTNQYTLSSDELSAIYDAIYQSLYSQSTEEYTEEVARQYTLH